MKFFRFCLVMLIVAIIAPIPSLVQAAEVELSWERPQASAAFIGFKLHWGVKRAHYTQHMEVPEHQTSVTIPNLQPGTTYYVAVTTVSPSGDESDFSNEVVVAFSADTDGDGISDHDERDIYGTNPQRADSDGNGVDDGDEIAFWGDAWSDDADGDGLINLLDGNAYFASEPDLKGLVFLAIESVQASADSEPNTAAQAIDGDLGTHWAAEGDGQWIQYDVGAISMISEVAIAWEQGDRRTAAFTLEVSSDGNTWIEIFSGDSSGTTHDFETYAFPAVAARYVLIAGYGNASDLWNEIAETEIYGQWISGAEIEEKTVGKQTYTVQLLAQDDFTNLDNWVMETPHPEMATVSDNTLHWDARNTVGTLWHRTEISGPSIVEYDVQALEGKLNINGIFYGSIMEQGQETLLEARRDTPGDPKAYRHFQNYTITFTDPENDGLWRTRFRKNPGHRLFAERYKKPDVNPHTSHRMTYVFADNGSMSLYVDGVRMQRYQDKKQPHRQGYHALRIYKTLANYKNFNIYRLLPDGRQ